MFNFTTNIIIAGVKVINNHLTKVKSNSFQKILTVVFKYKHLFYLILLKTTNNELFR